MVMSKFTVRDTVEQYEANYRRLMRLVPDIHNVEGAIVFDMENKTELRIQVVERCRYTTVITLDYNIGADDQWFSDPYMKVRVYDDAKVVEVITSQNYSRLKARYAFPNPKMLSQFEKRQVNRFLGEWLDHCLEQGRRCILEPRLTRV